MKSTRLRLSPVRALATQGLIYPMSSQVWQCCDEDSEEEPFVSVRQLWQLITDQIQVIEHLQRRRRRIARAYVRLRREHAHIKAQRCLR